MSYCLAIDIGASSGRHILGDYIDGKLSCQEIYRFENGFENKDGVLAWNIEHLTESVIAGIAECKKIGKIPETVAIDTWGVDYVLFDTTGKEILPAVAYRDPRTANAATTSIAYPRRKATNATINPNISFPKDSITCDTAVGSILPCP